MISLVGNKKNIVTRPPFNVRQCDVHRGSLFVSLVVRMCSTDGVHSIIVKSNPRLESLNRTRSFLDKTNRLQNKRVQLVDRKIFPSIYRNKITHVPSKIATVTGKQPASVQSNLETYLYLCCTTVGVSI